MGCSTRGSRDFYSSCGDVGGNGGQSRVSKGVPTAASLQTRVIAINIMVFRTIHSFTQQDATELSVASR